MRGRWDAKSNPRDYGIARNFGSGLRDRKTLCASLASFGKKVVKIAFWSDSVDWFDAS